MLVFHGIQQFWKAAASQTSATFYFKTDPSSATNLHCPKSGRAYWNSLCSNLILLIWTFKTWNFAESQHWPFSTCYCLDKDCGMHWNFRLMMFSRIILSTLQHGAEIVSSSAGVSIGGTGGVWSLAGSEPPIKCYYPRNPGSGGCPVSRTDPGRHHTHQVEGSSITHTCSSQSSRCLKT